MFLSENFHLLSASELSRLQKTLHVILRHNEKDRLQKTLTAVYSNLGNPSEVMQASGETSRRAFLKLLRAFGKLSRSYFSDKEIEALSNHPYTVWVEDECLIPGEVLRLIGKKENPEIPFLINHLMKLKKKEIEAWARWLGLDEPDLKPQNFYQHIASFRHYQNKKPEFCPTCMDGVDLKTVFPDNPVQSELAWFYRDILPFYEALIREECKLEIAEDDALMFSGTEDQRKRDQLFYHRRNVLNSFRYGRLIYEEGKPEFGQPVKYRIRATVEDLPAAIPEKVQSL